MIRKIEQFFDNAYLPLLAIVLAGRILYASMCGKITISSIYVLVENIAMVILLCMNVYALYKGGKRLSVIFASGGSKIEIVRKNRDEIILITLVFVTFIVSYLFRLITDGYYGDEETNTILVATVAAYAYSGSYKKILKTYLYTEGIIIIGLYIMSMLGLVINIRGRSFGFLHNTDYASHFLFLILALCFYYEGRLPKLVWAFMFAFIIADYFLINGKTAFGCLLLLVVASLFYELRSDEKRIKGRVAEAIRNADIPKVIRKIVGVILLAAFWIIALVMYILSACFESMPRSVQEIFYVFPTFAHRLALGKVTFDLFDIDLFGQYIAQVGAGGRTDYTRNYFFMDSSYVYALYKYGLVFFICIMLLMTFLGVRLYKKGRYYEVFLLAVVALDCSMEHHLTDIGYNGLCLLAFSKLRETKSLTEEKEDCECKGEGFHKKACIKGNKVAFGDLLKLLGGIMVTIVIICATISSYNISNYRGQEPLGKTTVILPGSYMEGFVSTDLRDSKVKAVVRFLHRNEGSVCIIAASKEEAKELNERLLTEGVSQQRLYLASEVSDLDSALSMTDNMIEEFDLPRRKAFCAFSFQEKRVSLRADKLGSYINSLEVKADRRWYLPLYALENVKTLKCILDKWISG